jgi:hypothetical protein
LARILGIVAFLILCAGVDLLGCSRDDVRFWLAAYGRTFRAMLCEQPMCSFSTQEAAHKHHGGLRLFLGMTFAFFLGPILITSSVLLTLHSDL